MSVNSAMAGAVKILNPPRITHDKKPLIALTASVSRAVTHLSASPIHPGIGDRSIALSSASTNKIMPHSNASAMSAAATAAGPASATGITVAVLSGQRMNGVELFDTLLYRGLNTVQITHLRGGDEHRALYT